jgi:membrane fusion protein (multidrug efflux system)
MSSPGAARVARILVAPGDRVHRGDALVEFERAPFEAEAARAEVARTAAQHAYERAQRMTAAGIVARKEVDAAASDLAQSEAALVTARRALELATLRSPIDGVVTKVGVSLGAFADAAQPAVEVVDPSALDLVLSLSPHDVASVRAGAPVTMLAGETGTGESLGTAVVAGVGATVDSVTRGVLVRARPARAMRPLRIGESVYGRITTAVHSAVTVPVEALVPNGEEFRVFVVDDHGVAHERDVVVGGRNESVAEIVKGLAPGERVVTYGAYGVEDSARVIPVKQ